MRKIDLGIFTPEVKADSVADLFRRIAEFGFTQVQFDFLSVANEEMPESISDGLLCSIKEHAASNNIKLSVINGTFNMAHPDKAVREDGIARFHKIAFAAKSLKCPYISLCTGTRTRDNMWVPHPDNNTQSAWNDMMRSIEAVLDIAEQHDVCLLLEPEASNVASTPEKVRKLIKEAGSNRLKVILDCANLFQPGTAYRTNVKDIIKNGFDLLSEYIAVAHGKDIKEGDGLEFVYTGGGIVDFEFFIRELDRIGFNDGIIIHGTKHEDEIPLSINHIRKLEEEI